MRWIIRGIVFVLLLAVVGAVSLAMLPGERIARIAADQISAMTGREVTLGGETRVAFWPVLGVATGAVSVANADWGQGGPLFRADSLRIGVEPRVLWGGDIRITGLEALNPEINLERAADGRVNWQLGIEGVAPSGQPAEGAAPARSKALALTLDRALIRNATFSLTDHATGARTRMEGMDFDLRWPEIAGRARFDITLRPAGKPLRIVGHLDRLDGFIDGRVSDGEARLTTDAGEMRFAGRLGPAPEAEGRLTVRTADTAALFAALGLARPDIPPGLGRTLNLDTRLTLTADRVLALRETVLALDRGNRFTGAADIALAPSVPRIEARLDAGALDLSGLGGGDGTPGAAATGTAGTARDDGWSTAPIDASALALVEGRVALAADSIDLGDLKLGRSRVLATLERARLVIDLSEVLAYDGRIAGNFVVNNRSGLSVGGDLTATGIDMERFLTDAAGVTRLSTRADARLKFLGVGQSEQAIMSSLKGEGELRAGQGVIRGFDLDRLMRSGQVSGGTTVFDTLQASFTIAGGRLFNDDLEMRLPRARAGGKGVIGLGARDIDYLFVPVLLEGENRKGLAIPVRIRGPWADPSIRPDLEKAIDLNLAEEKEELKQKAEEEVRRAVANELGVELEEGQTVEDALRDELKNEVKRELRKLFR